MPKKASDTLLAKAKKVLNKNWVPLSNDLGFTKPAFCLYPFQWNWDSGFLACGYAHYDFKKAEKELKSLFLGQWQNGFLPHIIFHEAEGCSPENYFPGPEIWNVQNVTDQAPKEVLTSAITQPPLSAVAVWHSYKVLREKDKKVALNFLEEFYPKLYALHNYLHTYRDPEDSGLITILHPWESGLDNSPRWDDALERVEPVDMSGYQRRDVQHVDPKFRPSDEDYGRYMALLTELRGNGYDEKKIYDTFPFKIKDILFSSIMYEADKRLMRMAERLHKDTKQIYSWMTRFESGLFEKCWNKECNCFYDFDIISGEQIKVNTVAAILPMITGLLSQEHIQMISEKLDETRFCGQQECKIKLAPSLNLDDEKFDHELYWRGPIWININWFIWKAFHKAGLKEKSDEMKEAMLTLVSDSGFWEYYSPLTGKGIGTDDFSWSAALTIDLLHDH